MASLARRRFCLALLLPTLARAAGDGPAPSPAPPAVPVPARVRAEEVQVRHQGDTWWVEARFVLPVPPALAWEVLTDFEHMAAILGNLEESRVLSRQGAVWQVLQKGRLRFGLFSFSFESLREITLSPRQRIQARGLGGNTRNFVSDLVLETVAGGTRLVYRAEMVPDFWLPEAVGPSLLQQETAERFSALAAEMQRRQGVDVR